MKILIVDDDTALCKELNTILTAAGNEVTCRDNAEDAVAETESISYDFILVDYRMPVHNGEWFMRTASIARSTKVLLITSYTDVRIIKHMFRLGVSGYIIKPFDEDDIIRHLNFHSPSAAHIALAAN